MDLDLTPDRVDPESNLELAIGPAPDETGLPWAVYERLTILTAAGEPRWTVTERFATHAEAVAAIDYWMTHRRWPWAVAPLAIDG